VLVDKTEQRAEDQDEADRFPGARPGKERRRTKAQRLFLVTKDKVTWTIYLYSQLYMHGARPCRRR
jgi:hypothetical protein